MPDNTANYNITPGECERTIGHCWGPTVTITPLAGPIAQRMGGKSESSQMCRHCGARSINRTVREIVRHG